MAGVHLDFYPPTRAGFIKLRIFESSGPEDTDPLTVIEEVLGIGEFPNYITEYSTDQASSVDDWFAISWEDDKGVQTDPSERVQGRTTTTVGMLVERVMLSNPDLDENVVGQSAEFVVSEVFRTQDPYSYLIVPTYRQLEGMTLLAQARAEIRLMVSNSMGTGESFTAGLVSMKSTTTSDDKTKLIDYLMREANRLLGIGTSVVAQICVGEIAGGLSTRFSLDESRLELLEIEP